MGKLKTHLCTLFKKICPSKQKVVALLATTQMGLAIIVDAEGLRLTPYRCPAGVPTIGYGTTYYPSGEAVKMSDLPITRESAKFFLTNSIQKFEKGVKDALTEMGLYGQLNNNQFSALVSFAYNVGLGPIVNKDRSMHRALVKGNIFQISQTFLLYNKAKVKGEHVILKGLMKRREAEAQLFLTLDKRQVKYVEIN